MIFFIRPFFFLLHFCTENPKNKKNFAVFLCLRMYKNIYLEYIFNKSIKINF